MYLHIDKHFTPVLINRVYLHHHEIIMSKQINRTKRMMTTTISHSIFQSIEQIAEEMGVNKNKVIEQAILVLEKTRKPNKRDNKKTPSAN